MNSMTGSTGAARTSTGRQGERLRGVDPSMKHIPGHHRYQQFTPDQMQLMNQGMGMVGPDSYLYKLAQGDPELMAQMEAPEHAQFQGGLGNLASKFSGMGMGARKSSSFQNQATNAMSQFAQQLQSNRIGLQRQAVGDIMNYSNMLMGQRPYALQEAQQKQPSGWGSILGGLGGFGVGMTTGNPFAAIGMSKMGSQMFGGL